MSYQKLNHFTFPLAFPIPCFYDEVQDIDIEETFFTVDMESGYWQVVVEEEAQERLAFFTPDIKRGGSDAYGPPKCISNIYGNDDEATNVTGKII